MAGHSQFKNIMYRKSAQDAKRSRMFTRFIREITVAARQGLPDPESNPRLRAAIQAARAANMPKDNIARAIKRASEGAGGEEYAEVRYEGFGPGGVGVIVEALTDNRNRTASDVRTAFTKHGGALAETGAVSHMFQRVGVMRYAAGVASAEAMFEAAVEAGADDVESGDDGHEVTCAPEALNDVREALERRFGDPDSARLGWKPSLLVELDDHQAEVLFRMLEALDENDDVQEVAANFEVADDVMQKLSA